MTRERSEHSDQKKGGGHRGNRRFPLSFQNTIQKYNPKIQSKKYYLVYNCCMTNPNDQSTPFKSSNVPLSVINSTVILRTSTGPK